MAKKIWNSKRNNTLMSMYESRTLGTSEMADRLHVSVPTVYNHLRRLGLNTVNLPKRYRAAAKVELSAAKKQRLVQLFAEGHKLAQIALSLGVTTGPIRRIARELGLTPSAFKPLAPGTRFGAITVVQPAVPERSYKGHHESRSHVRCDCGKELILFNHVLRSGNTTSCGCRIHRRSTDRDFIRGLCNIQSGAKQRGLEVALTVEHLKYMYSLPCGYCRTQSANEMKGRKSGKSTMRTVLKYSGIDRVDSARGYVLGNVIPCCRICNRAKSNLPLETFLGWLAGFKLPPTSSDVRRLCEHVASHCQEEPPAQAIPCL